MLMNGIELLNAVYISDVISSDFVKGQKCKVFKIAGTSSFLGFFDKYGEQYALPADRFELIE